MSDAAIEAVWRIESPRLIASLMRVVRDLDVAEELAQDAFVAALTQWPGEGIPPNPGAWLTAVAKRRAIDRFRRERLAAEKYAVLERDRAHARIDEPDFALLDDGIGDEVLRLIFIAAHPVLSTDARVALTLRLLGGLTTAEIARAFLTTESTVAQRIVRAKRTLAEARVPFEVPDRAERRARLASVLEVLYLIFNEGYAATAGDDLVRPQLCAEAMRLGRVLAELEPDESEVHGLVALMELHASRMHARTDDDGAPILLLAQDRTRWDRVLIRHGLAALARAEQIGGALGPYALQAAIAAVHARAAGADATDWPRIVALYDALAALTPSPVIDLNRAVAVAMAFGPAEGLAIVERLEAEGALARYHLLSTVRGDLLERLGRTSEACLAFERAAELTHNERERRLLTERAAACRYA